MRRVKSDRRRALITLTRDIERKLGLKHGDLLLLRLDDQQRLIVERLDGQKLADPTLQAEVEHLQMLQRSRGIAQAAQWNLWHQDYYRFIHHHRRPPFTKTPPPAIAPDEILPTSSSNKRKTVGESS